MINTDMTESGYTRFMIKYSRFIIELEVKHPGSPESSKRGDGGLF